MNRTLPLALGWIILLAACRSDDASQNSGTFIPTPLSTEVRPHNGKPTLFINNQPVYPIFYALTDSPGGRWSWEEMPKWNLQNFARQGFRLFQVDVWLESLWSPDGTLDMELARKQIRGVLDVQPDAAIVIRLHVNAPRWWQKKYPAEATGYADTTAVPQDQWGLFRQTAGDLQPYRRHSFASRRWRTEAGDKLREFCERLSKMPEGNALAGLHLADGVFHEWHYWAFFEHYPDTGPAMTRYFRQWLRKKYQTDPALQAAWHNPSVTLANARVPGVRERRQTKAGVFRDPKRERNVVDYVHAQHDVVADAILHFCRIAKESWPRPLLTGVFYGYFFTMFGRQAAGGHLEADRILASPYVDYLSAPQSYQAYCREIGGTGQSRGIVESCRINGKLWLDEMDRLTTVERDFENLTIKNLPDDIATIRRNIAHSYTRGMGAWYFDFGPKLTTGWWDHPALLAEIRQLRQVLDRYHTKPYESPADVLFVYDTDVFYYMGYDFRSDPVSPGSIDAPSADAYHSGVAFDMIYLSDLEKVEDWSKYKAVVFANTFYLTDRQRQYIKSTIARNGRHLVWNYLPGYTNGDSLSLDFVSDVVGMRLQRLDAPVSPTIVIGKDTLALRDTLAPMAVVTDNRATRRGYLQSPRHVAFASRQLPESTSWFCSLPVRRPAVFREIFQKAGAHIYSDQGDVLYAGGGVLCVHTLNGGSRTIALRDGKEVNVKLTPRSTVVLDAKTGKVLIQ